MTTQLDIRTREADDERLADYMADRLTPAQEGEFEQQLIDDPEFFRAMMPFLSLMYPVSEPSPAEIAVRQRAAATRAKLVRAKEAREARRRRLKGFVAAIVTAAFPVKAIVGLATTATLIYAVGLFDRSPEVTTPPVFVHVPAKTPVGQTPTIVAQTPVRQHRTTIAAPTQVSTEVDIPAFTLDSAQERAIEHMVADSVTSRFTLSPMKADSVTGRVLTNVAAIPAPAMPLAQPSILARARAAINETFHGAAGALGAIARGVGGALGKGKGRSRTLGQ